MKLFKATIATFSNSLVRYGYILAMYDVVTDTYYGWSDHRGLRLPRGEWIRFRGQDRMVEPYQGPAYRNGFHTITGMVQLQKICTPIFNISRNEYRVAEWCKVKHRKRLHIKEIEVELRFITYIGEMVFTGEEGPDYRGCVAMKMRLPQ